MRPLRVMTFNLRWDDPRDRRHPWSRRKDAAAAIVSGHEPDVVGTQEGLLHQLRDLDQRLPGYERVGTSREGADEDEFNAIYFDSRRLAVEDAGDRWLSETPDVPGSAHWGNAHPRIVSWARLRDRESGRTFTVANTHLDHVSRQSRRRSALAIADIFPDAVLLGDFNAMPGGVVHRGLTGAGWRDSFDAHPRPPKSGRTFHRFTGWPIARIDWILVPSGARVLRHHVARERPGGILPSDHFPVVADVTLDGA